MPDTLFSLSLRNQMFSYKFSNYFVRKTMCRARHCSTISLASSCNASIPYHCVSSSSCSVCNPAACMVLEMAVDDAFGSATHLGNLDGSWFWPGLTMATAVIQRVNKQVQGLSTCFSPPLFQMNKWISKSYFKDHLLKPWCDMERKGLGVPRLLFHPAILYPQDQLRQ